MARKMRNTKTTPNAEIDVREFKKALREKIIDKYGSIVSFLKSEDAKKIGISYSDRPYLYDTCSVSTAKLNKISALLGGETLKREISIIKSVKYYIAS